VDRGKNHWYIDTDTDQKIPGVTSLMDGLPKPALINWAGNATAEYAVDHWDELAALTPSVRLKTLQGARYASRDAAANKGTQVHRLAEKLVQGDRVTVPDELAGYVQSYTRFLDEYDVRPVLVERTVYSAQHNYCGTFDLIADLLDPDDPDPDVPGRKTWLLDIKTSRSGIFGETALQLAGYRYADVYIDGEDDTQYEMPDVDLCGGIHVRADGYDLIPLQAGPLQHRQFLYVAQVAAFVASSRDLIGEPVASPSASTYRLVREDS
jgi:hypothetical protein